MNHSSLVLIRSRIYQVLSSAVGAYIVLLAIVGTYRRHNASDFWGRMEDVRLQYDVLAWGSALLAFATLVAVWSSWPFRFYLAAFFFVNVAGTSLAPMLVDFFVAPEGAVFWSLIWLEPIVVAMLSLVLMSYSLVYARTAKRVDGNLTDA